MSFLQTLAAVLVGGGVTLLAQLVMERRREKIDRRRQDDESEVQTRMAARLVVLDLISMLSMLKSAQETGRWWNELQLPVGAWLAHSEALSRSLADRTWRVVGSTFAGAAAWNELARGARRYYWVMPRLNLRRLELQDMHDALLEGAAAGIQELLPIAMPTVSEADPLHVLARDALDGSSKETALSS
jgi:hypothetical protein